MSYCTSIAGLPASCTCYNTVGASGTPSLLRTLDDGTWLNNPNYSPGSVSSSQLRIVPQYRSTPDSQWQSVTMSSLLPVASANGAHIVVGGNEVAEVVSLPHKSS